jgi:hypothetical protein
LSDSSNENVMTKAKTKKIKPIKVKQQAAVSAKALSIHRTSTGEIKFVGRPAWTTEAKKLRVNQDPNKTAGGILVPVEDRRHLLHWDEQLKPLLNSIFTAMEAEFKKPDELLRELKKPIAARGYRTQAKTVDQYMLYVAGRINGSPDNLVPDRFDINQAIEKVRANLRSYARALQKKMEDSDEFLDVPQQGALQISSQTTRRLAIYKSLARDHLSFDPNLTGDTPIHQRINEIHGEILGLIDGIHAPHQLWMALHEFKFSVTFDLSHKATRDKTDKSLAWLDLMRRNFDMSPRQRYLDLLSFLD